MFGTEQKIGLRDSVLAEEVYSSLETEEDLKHSKFHISNYMPWFFVMQGCRIRKKRLKIRTRMGKKTNNRTRNVSNVEL